MSTEKLADLWEQIRSSTDYEHYEITEAGNLIDSEGRHIGVELRDFYPTLKPFVHIGHVVSSAAPDYRLAQSPEIMIPIEYIPPKWA